MERSEYLSITKEFWKSFDAGDTAAIDAQYRKSRGKKSLKELVNSATMALVLGREDACDRLGDLLWHFGDRESGSMSGLDLQDFYGIIIHCLDTLADRNIQITLPMDIDRIADTVRLTDDSPLWMLLGSPDDTFNRLLNEKLKNLKKPEKVNIFLSYLIHSLASCTVFDQFEIICLCHVDTGLTAKDIAARKSMKGDTEYAELVAYAAEAANKVFSEENRRFTKERKMMHIGEDMPVTDFEEFYYAVSRHRVEPVSREWIDGRCGELSGLLRQHASGTEMPKVPEDFIKSLFGIPSPEEPKAEPAIDLSAVRFEDIHPEAKKKLISDICKCTPKSAEELLLVAMALVTDDRYQQAYSLFSEKRKELGITKSDFDMLIDHIADDISYYYVRDRGSPTLGHADDLASLYPGGPAVFFERFGSRVMSHLQECKNAKVATNLPDAFAMYSRFIFDCYDVGGIARLFRKVAEAYEETGKYIAKYSKRFGKRSYMGVNLCSHSRTVYEAMADFLAKNFEEDDEYFSLHPIMAGHEFDGAFYRWFMHRDMEGDPGADAYAAKYMTDTLKSIIGG